MHEKVETTEQTGKNGKVKKEGTNNVSLSSFSFKFPPCSGGYFPISCFYFFSGLVSLFSFMPSPHKPMRLPLLLYFSKSFLALNDSFFLIFFILSLLPLCSVVLHSSFFSPFRYRSQVALLPPSLLDFYALF